MDDVVIRPAQPDDCAAILLLMRELARFEGYESEFKVTEAALADGLFEQRKFHVLVASYNGSLVGLLTYYFLPFTYDLSPWIYIKELYVGDDYRSRGIGKALMNAVVDICRENRGTKIRWDVLAENRAARNFILRSALAMNSNGSFSASMSALKACFLFSFRAGVLEFSRISIAWK